MQAAAKKPKTLQAQASPSLEYIGGQMIGKTAATMERVTTVEAIALAQ